MQVMNPQALRRYRLQGARCYFGGLDGGGIGNSDSASTTKTENNDQRVVGGDSSVNSSTKLEISGSSNDITLTDQGAIGAGLQLALKGLEVGQSTARESIASNGALLDGVLKNAGAEQAAVIDTISNIKTSDVRVLIVAGLAVVGIGAAVAFKGKG